MKSILTIIIVFLFTFAYSQKSPIKFGKIDKDLLEMTACEYDSTAPAVVLCDYGYFNGNTFTFTRLLRIKILSKDGYNWANRTFSTRTKSSIKGVTYNIEDGKIIKDKLKNSSIYSEHVYKYYYRMRVAMPNVKVGSVIDIEYSFIGLPQDWYFQREIPVLRSELVIERSTYVTFRKNFFGFIPLSISTPNRWVAVNVPAFNEEPFINSKENYISKFEIEIKKISFPGYYANYASDWNGVYHSLNESYGFGTPLNAGNSFIKGMAKHIKKNNFTDEEKIVAALDTIHSIKWNEDEWLYTTESELKFQYNKGVGNSADINIGLIVLLKKLGFEVYPVALSTRSNGLLSSVNPSLRKLNYVVAYAKVNGNFVLIDATDRLLPYYLLPKRCLNQKGRIIDKDTANWVDLYTKRKFKRIAMYNIDLESDMTMNGTISYISYDYAAYDIRKKMEAAIDEDEYIDNFIIGKDGLTINDATFTNIDSIYKPVKVTYDVTIDDLSIQSDSLLYLAPLTYEKMDKNLFKTKTREYPVDFAYPRERSGVISITIPDNIEVSRIPDPLRLVMPDNLMDYVYSISQIGNKLIVNYRLRINEPVVSMLYYDKLRSFYDFIIEKEAEPITFKLK